MAKTLYNEGRVVGYSTYELYVKHALEENPDQQPASEKEWLANQLARGLAMILKIKASDVKGAHKLDIPLPANSALATSNTIVGHLFFGECEIDGNGWATKVLDYGQGLSNTEESSPSTTEDATSYPTKSIAQFEDELPACLQYLKLQDGLVLQPGAWVTTEDGHPYKDITPNFKSVPVVRLIFASEITSDFYILLEGFSHKSILQAIAQLDTDSTDSSHPENGDFLGPAVFPWGTKIVFTYPPTITYYLRKNFKSTYLNLKIEHDEDSIDTIFTASYLKPNPGISIFGPNEAGGDILIGAKINEDANKYIKVQQTTSTENGAGVTTLTHSRISAGKGISFQPPQTAGGDVIIAAPIQSKNNYLKVEQSKNDGVNPENTFTTSLTSSTLAADTDSGIKIEQPTTPGQTVKLSSKIESSNIKYLKVVQEDGKTILQPLAINHGDDFIIIEDSENGPVLKLDMDKIIEAILSDGSKLVDLLNQILAKIGTSSGSAISDGQINWAGSAASERIPTGSLNIYSTYNKSIRVHATAANGDINFNKK